MNIEESASNYIPNNEIKSDELSRENGYPNEGSEQPKQNSFWSMLKSETGEGSIQSYSNHPLNLKSNDYVSQIIRGLTGMIGSLNFAIIDIFLGGFGLFKEKRDHVDYEVVNDSDEKVNHNKKNDMSGPTIVNGQRNV